MVLKTIPKNCLFCGTLFQASMGEHKRGNAKFCSHSCCSKNTHKKQKESKTPNVVCALCGKHFYRPPAKIKAARHFLQFCCRAHKDEAQRIGGIKEIQPAHYGNGNRTYRAKAFRSMPKQCSKCGYMKYPEILLVHHLDGNRDNNNISNLIVLCSTCHDETHFLSKTGKWSQTKNKTDVAL